MRFGSLVFVNASIKRILAFLGVRSLETIMDLCWLKSLDICPPGILDDTTTVLSPRGFIIKLFNEVLDLPPANVPMTSPSLGRLRKYAKMSSSYLESTAFDIFSFSLFEISKARDQRPR